MIELDEFLLDPKLQTATKPVGIVDGPYGVWLLEYYKFLNGMSDIIYDHLRSKMNRMTRLYNESSDYTFSLGHGLVGFLWTMKCIIHDPGIYNKIILKDYLIPMIEEECLRMIRSQNYDLFTGAHGLLMYLVSIDSLQPHVYASYVQGLEEKLFGNDTLSFHAEQLPQEGYSGVFQGVTGMILMLSRLYQYRPSTRSRKLIQRVIPAVVKVDWSSENHTNPNPFANDFPTDPGIMAENLPQLGMGYALVKAGVVLNNRGYSDAGFQLLNDMHHRQEYDIDNLSICYGAPNMAYIYHKLWKFTGFERFHTVRNKWIDHIHELWHASDKVRIHSTIPHDPTQIPSLTHGFAGPRLALLSMQGKIGDQWDEWMLL